MPGQGSGSEWVGNQGQGRWERGFSEGNPGKGITFEMQIKYLIRKGKEKITSVGKNQINTCS